MEYLKPRGLKKGDTIALLSLSWGGPHIFPHIFEKGIQTLRNLGFHVKEYPTTRMSDEELSMHPEMRVRDLHAAFQDECVAGIIASIGGDDSVRLLPLLDMDLIKKNHKFFMGYSDTCTMLLYLASQGMMTFHGPTVMAGLAQWDYLGELYQKHIQNMMFISEIPYRFPHFSQCTDGYLPWHDPENAGKIFPLQAVEGWRVLQGKGPVRGRFWGGCMEVLEMMKATPYWPQSDFWNDKIFFLETSEDAPTPEQVKYVLRNYALQGVFTHVKAFLFGRSKNYTQEQHEELYRVIVQVIVKEFGHTSLPIIANMSIGHLDPQYMIPLGVEMEIDMEKKDLVLMESPYRK